MKEKQRIAYVVNAFPVVSETFILNELRAVEMGGFELVILALGAPPRGPVHRGVSELRARVIRLPEKRWDNVRLHAESALRTPRSYFPAVADLARSMWSSRSSGGSRMRRLARRFHRSVWAGREVRRFGAAHLHAHYASEPLEVAVRAARIAQTTFSFTAHAKDLFTTPRKRLRRRVSEAAFAVTCHRAGWEELSGIARSRDRSKVLQIPHGIDTKIFDASRRDPRPGTILAVGRLTPKKGFDRLIAACSLLSQRGVDFRCEIVGDGRERAKLASAIGSAELNDRIKLRRFVEQGELRGMYRKAAVLAAPAVQTADGNRDGLQNVVIEAMACGVPVVASRVGGIPEAIDHEQTGLLIPPGDVEALADALESLICDPARAESLGRTAARTVEKLDFRDTNAPLLERFRSLLPPSLDARVKVIAESSWQRGDIADRASKALGVRPTRKPEIEDEIRRRILPGLRANSWRPDFEKIAQRRLWDEFFKGRRLKRLEAAVGGSHSGVRVLDLGCGRGGLAVALHACGAEVVAIDFRKRNCAMARHRGRRYEFEIPVGAAAGERLPFAPGSFDRVFCLEVLEHAQDPVAILREIRAVLAPGGACALTIVNRFAHRDPHYHLWGVNFLPRSWAMHYVRWRGRSKQSSGDRQALDDMHYYRYADFVRLAGELGFRVEDPDAGVHGLERMLHRIRRRTSLGFNDALLVLRV